MRPFVDALPGFQSINEQYQARVSELFGDLKPRKRGERLRADIDFASAPEYADALVIIREGYLTFRRNDRRLFTYEPGDLVGIERMFRSLAGVEISSSFPVTVDIYPADAFFSYLVESPNRLDLWSELLILKLDLYSALLATFAETKLRHITPREVVYKEGETIIHEGERGDTIYSLVKGKAVVSVQGTEVGEVREEEVFGVLAALGSVPRTATITARTECQVLMIGKDDFSELIKLKPSTFEKVMQDMARAINDLNRHIAESSSGKAYQQLLNS